jgi:hypothetical protein
MPQEHTYNNDPMPHVGAGERFEAASDYAPDEAWTPPQKIVEHLQRLIGAATELSHLLGMDDPTLWLSNQDAREPEGKDVCAVYLWGTAELPAMVIFTDHFKKVPEENLARALATTIWHELAHAWLECQGAETEQSEEVEDICEAFAEHVEDSGPEKAFEELKKSYRKLLLSQKPRKKNQKESQNIT